MICREMAYEAILVVLCMAVVVLLDGFVEYLVRIVVFLASKRKCIIRVATGR